MKALVHALIWILVGALAMGLALATLEPYKHPEYLQGFKQGQLNCPAPQPANVRNN